MSYRRLGGRFGRIAVAVLAIVVLAVGLAPGTGLWARAGSDMLPAEGTSIGDRPPTADSDKPTVARVDEVISPTGERTRVYWLTGLLPDGRLAPVLERDLAKMPDLDIRLEPGYLSPSESPSALAVDVGLLAGTGSISGTIRDTSGCPMSGALVYANGWNGGGYGSASADALGKYTIPNLSPGVYIVYTAAG